MTQDAGGPGRLRGLSRLPGMRKEKYLGLSRPVVAAPSRVLASSQALSIGSHPPGLLAMHDGGGH